MNLICMSFDGEYVIEGRDFETSAAAWGRAADMGSRWFFYPFCFVTTASGKTILDAPQGMAHLVGRRVSTVQELFRGLAALPEMQGVDAEEFGLAVSHITF